MNELIKVTYDSERPTISGRDLHEALEVETPYRIWFPRMCEYGFAESVSVSKTSILVRDLAKLITQNGVKIGQNRLFEWLRENKYLIKGKSNDHNHPTQRAIEMGLFEVHERVINNGEYSELKPTPYVTGKGQVYFINKFLGQATDKHSAE